MEDVEGLGDGDAVDGGEGRDALLRLQEAESAVGGEGADGAAAGTVEGEVDPAAGVAVLGDDAVADVGADAVDVGDEGDGLVGDGLAPVRPGRVFAGGQTEGGCEVAGRDAAAFEDGEEARGGEVGAPEVLAEVALPGSGSGAGSS